MKRYPMLRRVGSALFWPFIVIYLSFCVALLALKWVVLPEIDRYRSEVQHFFQTQTGVPVQIGRVQAHWKGFGPELTLHAMQLPMPSGELGFSAESVRMQWSLSSILTFSPRLSNLEVISPSLKVARNSHGKFEVAGIPTAHDGIQGHPLLDWILTQKRVLLSKGVVNWQDDMNQFPAAKVLDMQLLLKNGLNRHEAGLSFLLPAWTHKPVHASLNFKTPLLESQLGDLRKWKGTFYVNAQTEHSEPMELLLKAFRLNNIQIRQPKGRLWLDFKEGFVQHALLDARVEKIRFSNLKEFGPTDLFVEKTKVNGAAQWGVKIRQLDAAQAQIIAQELGGHLGFEQGLEVLKSLELSGQINRINLNWVVQDQASNTIPLEFNADADFSKLTVLHRTSSGVNDQKITGFRNLSGHFKGNNAGGQWVLAGKNSQVVLPEIFSDNELKFDELTGQGEWKILPASGQPIEFSIHQLMARNLDLQAEVSGRYEFHHKQAGVANLKGRIVHANVARVANYLPLVIDRSTQEWLAENLKAGLAKNGEFELSGHLSHFPFDNPKSKGIFKVEVPFENGELTYAQGWPSIQKMNGKALFEGNRMLIQVDTAESVGVSLNNVQARIDKLDALDPALEIKGQSEGELAKMVTFVNQSPVRAILENVLVNSQVDGNANLDLKLSVPLATPEQTQVKGDLMLKGNTIRLDRGMPTVSNANGLIQFSNKGVFIAQLQGQALGDAVTVKASTDHNGRMEFRANGIARAKGLAQYLNPLVEPYLAGATPYAMVLTTRDTGMSIEVSSQLQGLEVNLPLPFFKKSDARMPFKLSQTSTAQGERWSIDLGSDGKFVAQLRAAVLDQRGPSGRRLESLQFAVGSPLALPGTGIHGNVYLPVIDFNTWRSLIGRTVSVSGDTTGLIGEITNHFTAENPMKLKIGIRGDQLNMGGKSFEGVSVAVSTIDKRWQFDVKAKGVDGYLSWVSDHQRPDGAVLARFKKLAIPKTLDSGLRDLVQEPASSIPALDIEIEDFVLNNLPLGSLKLIATNQSHDEQLSAAHEQRPRQWKLEELRIENLESVTRAKGIWQYGSGLNDQRTDIEVNQTVKNAGDLLSRLGMRGVFQGGQGTLDGRLRWNDAPTHMDYQSLSGQFKLKSSKGQFLKADPGVAKLLGVLSLQSIPRRFTLDFKDVFSDGFFYDTLEADVTLKEGIANTQNFKMTGPNATVLMDGNLNLATETQNLNVLVLPHLNPAGGSLIYSVIAANPAVGIASLIADLVLKDPLSKIFSFQYKVSGPWLAPVIEKVRKDSGVVSVGQ